MSDPREEVLEAIDQLVKWAQARDIPPGEWTAPIQDLLLGKDMLSMGLKQLLFPVAVFDRRGVIEMANDKLLEGTGLNTDDIKAGKANIKNIADFDFSEAAALALRGETHVVNDLKNPLRDLCDKGPEDMPDYKCAILYAIFRDMEPTRGVAVFLPFDYRPDNA